MRARKGLSVSACSMLLLAALPAAASDGVLEINQAKALAGGASPIDTPGFPVSLSGDQSVRLTSNLELASAPGATIETTAIEVFGGGVASIDLNGFSISGFGAGAGGGGMGIHGPGSATMHVSNGTVRAFGASGIELSSGMITAVRLEANGAHGVSFLATGVVHASAALNNGNSGFSSDGPLDVFDSISTGNGQSGFRTAGVGSFHGCRATGNSSYGFDLSGGFVIASEGYANSLAQLYCGSVCMLTTNFFPGCGGIGQLCFAGGPGSSLVQLPPGSNLCGVSACP